MDLLEALKKSREEVQQSAANASSENNIHSATHGEDNATSSNWLGDGTVRPIDYPDLARPPPLPTRPPLRMSKSSSSDIPRAKSAPQYEIKQDVSGLNPITNPSVTSSRTLSPEKKGGMLRTLRPQGRGRTGSSSSSKMNATMRGRPPPTSAQAATQAWSSTSRPEMSETSSSYADAAARTSLLLTPTLNASRTSVSEWLARQDSLRNRRTEKRELRHSAEIDRSSIDYRGRELYVEPVSFGGSENAKRSSQSEENLLKWSKSGTPKTLSKDPPGRKSKSPPRLPKLDDAAPGVLSYRKEYPESSIPKTNAIEIARRRHGRPLSRESSDDALPTADSPVNVVRRKPINCPPTISSAKQPAHLQRNSSPEDRSKSPIDTPHNPHRRNGKARTQSRKADTSPASSLSPDDTASDCSTTSPEAKAWQAKVSRIMKRLPKGVDRVAAQQILHEIVLHGDEVHWSDIAGLDVAKAALKETVVYPFLRPDLFSGLREPARGMLLFGPPGTGKTMLARAVATESRSTFFATSASSLTSKYLGESEKLVRALFALAKALAPSIVFVDEIDSLLSSRSGSGEHEATRRIKTEFLIQWSDLQRAAVGRESERDKGGGDASRVLVLAATNMPWAIDEAARRRFVRRQYIPLPEAGVRKVQLEILLSHQKHGLDDEDIERLVGLTEGMSSVVRLI